MTDGLKPGSWLRYMGEAMLDSARTDSTSPDAGEAARTTPSMAQYMEIKAANPDCLLFYRMGDFYELFFADAEIASRALGIVLTKRGKHGGQDIPMCGVPVVRADDYLQRLIALGHRVAVCEQLEDPAEARKRGSKAVVRRDVVRLVTPGTITEEALLRPGEACLLVALARRKASDDSALYGLAAVDISTGRFTLSEVSEAHLIAELARLDPREIVAPDVVVDDPALKTMWRDVRASVTPVPRDGLDGLSAERHLREHFGVATLDAFGAFSRAEVAAAGTALLYIERTQRAARPRLSPPRRDDAGGTMRIDPATRANLELMRTLSGERQGSLLAIIDRTLTPPGGRLIAEQLASPLTDVGQIEARLDAITLFVEDGGLRDGAREALARAPDLERAFGRLALGRGGPRDLKALAAGLQAAHALSSMIGDRIALPALLAGARAALAQADLGLAGALEQAVIDEAPLLARDGNFIREGWRPELDDLRALQSDSRVVIARLQMRYVEETGIRNLRVKHNNLLGYFIEVAQGPGDMLLKEPLNRTFIHRQTMAGALRFTSAELADLQDRIASAAGRAHAMELALFEEMRAAVLAAGEAIAGVARALAVVDVATALADLAVESGWTRPLVSEGTTLAITGGRHPVVEAALKREGKPFVANDCDLGHDGGGRIVLLTGPNMAGKSTYLRQTALIAVLAQMGSYVPARQAHVGVVDRLFSRVGAADDLARGRSTFMVEMVETAAILNQAGPRALVILDEIGRGTATFDGLSIAWASVEHLHEVNRCRALFATHFHELTALADRLPRLANATMRVSEWQGDVIFLHEVQPGAADRSYGIQVAKLAGLPPAVVERARLLLAELEKSDRERPVPAILDDLPLFALPARRAASAGPVPKADPIRDQLGQIDPDELTPREALDALYRLKKAARDG